MVRFSCSPAAASIAILVLAVNQGALGRPLTREHQLEARIRYLEERLNRLEGVVALSQGGAAVHRTDAGSTKSGKAPSPLAAGPDVGSAPIQTEASAGADRKEPIGPLQIGVGAPGDTPQELAVLRQNSVTLKANKFEISTEAAYVSRHSPLQTDRTFLSTTTIRYGVLDWLELSATAPFGLSDRTTRTGPGTAVAKDVRGFGDLLLQANARIFEQTRDLPGVVISLGAFAPTGPSPYDFSRYGLDRPGSAPTPNPRNPLSNFFSTGAWGARTNLQFYKTVDPMILFCGAGVDYLFPQRIAGFAVDNPLRFNYNFGVSFAASDKTTLGFSVNGSYDEPLQVNNRKVFDSSGEPIFARLSVIQRMYNNVYVEPAVAIGLTPDVPNVALEVGVRAQF